MTDRQDKQIIKPKIPYTYIATYIALLCLSAVVITIITLNFFEHKTPSDKASTSTPVEIKADEWEATSAAPKALCLPPTRERLNQHFNEVYGEDFVHTEHINPTDRTKPYILCPVPLVRGKWNPKHVYVFGCQICIPSGIVMDLPYQ